MKVAVLGAAGFVGGHLVRCLEASGDSVRRIVRRAPLQAVPGDTRIADACDVYALRAAASGCDYLVHAALGTNNEIVDSIAPVYAAAEGVGIKRLVYLSSGSVYGQTPAPGTDERTPLSVRHAFAYNTAKVRAERKLRRLRRRGTVEIVILRPTIVFGPGSRWVFDFADAVTAGTACVVDGGEGICNSIYVDNLAHAVRLALTRPGIDGEVFLVGDAETVTWADLYRPIAAAFGADFASVPSVHPPDPVPSLKQLYIDPVRSSQPARALASSFPSAIAALKTVVRSVRRMLRARAQRHEPSLPVVAIDPSAAVAPAVSPEMIALQRCRCRLPHDKAARMLGYDPPVSFAEACRRSAEWAVARAARRAGTR